MSSLKTERGGSGRSMTQVSESSGLTRASISELENSRTVNPTLNTIYSYAYALGMTVRWGGSLGKGRNKSE